MRSLPPLVCVCVGLGAATADAQEGWETYRSPQGYLHLEMPTPPGAEIDELVGMHGYLVYRATRRDEHAELFVDVCWGVRRHLAYKTNPPRFVERWRVIAGPELGAGFDGHAGPCVYLSAPLDETLGDDLRVALSKGRAWLYGAIPGGRLERSVLIRQRSRPPKRHPVERQPPSASPQGLGLLAMFWLTVGALLLHDALHRESPTPELHAA